MKACKECGETKPVAEFSKDRSKRDGLNFYCKACSRVRSKRFLMRPPRKIAPEGMKRCSRCKETLALAAFGNSTRTHDGFDRRCKACNFSLHSSWRLKNLAKSAAYIRQYRLDNRDRVKDHERKKSYGVPHGWYAETLAAQGGKCAICPAEKAQGRGDFHVDHCHFSGKVRGLLCHRCNLMIGQARDSTTVLEAAIHYLKKHS